ncbi:hypothetical protein SBA2_680004 [Acidobacteriia bacterium SbA2]|nr:hypothetical protein SBA2_680004 [Acidobacteriia bacterium SbA2]
MRAKREVNSITHNAQKPSFVFDADARDPLRPASPQDIGERFGIEGESSPAINDTHAQCALQRLVRTAAEVNIQRKRRIGLIEPYTTASAVRTQCRLLNADSQRLRRIDRWLEGYSRGRKQNEECTKMSAHLNPHDGT